MPAIFLYADVDNKWNKRLGGKQWTVKMLPHKICNASVDTKGSSCALSGSFPTSPYTHKLVAYIARIRWQFSVAQIEIRLQQWNTECITKCLGQSETTVQLVQCTTPSGSYKITQFSPTKIKFWRVLNKYKYFRLDEFKFCEFYFVQVYCKLPSSFKFKLYWIRLGFAQLLNYIDVTPQNDIII